MDLSLERTATSYAVTLDEDDFLALTRIEHEWPLRRSLCEDLSALSGVSDVEYDGHFGAAVYFTIDIENDENDRHREILALIERHVELAKRTPRKDTGAIVRPDGFFLGPMDVVVAAAAVGHEIDLDTASAMLKEADEEELVAICVAVVEASDDPEERTLFARNRLGSLIADGGMTPPARLRQ